MSLSFENIVFKSASLGEENPMPDLKNNSYIHAKFSTTDNVTVSARVPFQLYCRIFRRTDMTDG